MENKFNKNDSQGIFIFNKSSNLHLELKNPVSTQHIQILGSQEFYRQYSKKQKSL